MRSIGWPFETATSVTSARVAASGLGRRDDPSPHLGEVGRHVDPSLGLSLMAAMYAPLATPEG